MDEDIKTPEQNFSGVELQICPTDYHTWDCPVFVLETPLQEGPAELPKWELRSITRVILGQSAFHAGSVVLVLNTITGHVYPN